MTYLDEELFSLNESTTINLITQSQAQAQSQVQSSTTTSIFQVNNTIFNNSLNSLPINYSRTCNQTCCAEYVLDAIYDCIPKPNWKPTHMEICYIPHLGRDKYFVFWSCISFIILQIIIGSIWVFCVIYNNYINININSYKPIPSDIEEASNSSHSINSSTSTSKEQSNRKISDFKLPQSSKPIDISKNNPILSEPTSNSVFSTTIFKL